MRRKNLFTRFAALLKRLFRKQPRRITYPYHVRRNMMQKNRKLTQQEIDTLLDKIAERGYDRLTPEEKQKLLDASHSL